MRQEIRALAWVALCAPLIASPAGAYEHTGYRWPPSALPIPYRINQNLAPGCPEAINEIRESFRAWEGVSDCAIRYKFAGTTMARGTQNDGVNVVSWSTGTAGAVGLTTIWFKPNREVTDCDMELNANLQWDCIGSPSAYQVRNVVTHEAGHFLVLDDKYTPSDAEDTMYGIVVPGETKKTTLEADDMQGARDLYPTGPPLPPVGLSAATEPGAILLQWGRTISYNLATYNLYRREEGQTAPGLLAGGIEDFRYRGMAYRDATVQPGTVYFYRMSAVDAEGREGMKTDEVAGMAGTARPKLLAGGYLTTSLDHRQDGPGVLSLWMLAETPSWRQLFLELWYGGARLDPALSPEEWNDNYAAFFLTTPLNASGLPPARFLLSGRVVNDWGEAAPVWPFLTVE